MDITLSDVYGLGQSSRFSYDTSIGKHSKPQAFVLAGSGNTNEDRVDISDQAREKAEATNAESSTEASVRISTKSAQPDTTDEQGSGDSKVERIRRQITEVQNKLAAAMARLNDSGGSSAGGSSAALTAATPSTSSPQNAPQRPQTQNLAESVQVAADGAAEGTDAAQAPSPQGSAEPAKGSREEVKANVQTESSGRSAAQQEIATLTAQLLTLHKQLQDAVKEEASGGGSDSAVTANVGGVWSPTTSGASGVSIRA